MTATPSPPRSPRPGRARRDLSYDDAIREALARNNDLKATKARLDQARAIGWKAWASQLPQVAAGASWTRNDKQVEIPALPPPVPEPIALQPLIARGAQVQATVPLFAPQLWFGIAAAESGQRQAELTLETSRREIVFGVARLYYGAVGGKYAVQITKKQAAMARDHEQDAGPATGPAPRPWCCCEPRSTGLAPNRISRLRGRVTTRPGRPWRRSDRQGADFEVEAPGEPPLPQKSAEFESSALRDRPDVQAAAAALEAAERARGGIWSSYLPSLGALGRVQWQDPPGLTGENRSWAVGVALTWDIFDGTRREAQLRESGARVAEAEANRRSAELRAREEVVRARLDLEVAIANQEKAQEQRELARESQRIVDVSYREGAATYIEVSDANNQLIAAELAAVGEQVKSRLAALQLLRSRAASTRGRRRLQARKVTAGSGSGWDPCPPVLG
jgi:outer membrane protein TolC